MNCHEARLAIGADPGALPPELADHLGGCQACSAYRQEMTTLDGHIRRALAVDPPGTRHAAPMRARVATPARRWALAASVALAFLAAVGFWALRPTDALARDIAAHVDHEPASWLADTPMPPAAVRLALRGAGVTLDETAGEVVYARMCPFRGRDIPHVVVNTARGPITVLLLPGERLSAVQRFDEHGYSGTLLQSSGGAIAVLARGDADLDEVAVKVERAVRWEPVTPARTR